MSETKKTSQPAGKQEAKSAAAREKICLATIRCLADIGYAETSINRVVKAAEVSKGALQHHFPTKEDLMAATAERLLANAHFTGSEPQDPAPATDHEPRSTAEDLLYTWQKMVNTDAYRALLEILITIRTDKNLQDRLSPSLRDWDKRRTANSFASYTSTTGRDEDVDLLMTMTNCLMRGLVIHEQYAQSPAEIERLVARWIELVSPLLTPKDKSH